MVLLFDVLARLPLSLLHWLGAMLGRLTYLVSARYASRLRENLRQAGYAESASDWRRILRANIREAGKGMLELPWVWRRPYPESLSAVRRCEGWQHLQAAADQGKGVIVLTPHMGCFDIIAAYIASHLPITVLYRPPRQQALDGLMQQARTRGQMKLAATDLGGVRQLLKALKRKELVGILPDQVPGNGEGEWAPFFGRPAYTMTLIGRLMQSSGAPVVMAWSQRLPRGAGYAIHFAPLDLNPAQSIPQQLNAALEEVIRKHPEQYLWSYNRYKVPRGALPPDAGKES
ncbi:MAG: lysophospholipid acyltransferase family protein [Sideroxyarcus sp.]|nr:lysophospholipid acyltransferase family protein [Sideroxyarcus sp.]